VIDAAVHFPTGRDSQTNGNHPDSAIFSKTQAEYQLTQLTYSGVLSLHLSAVYKIFPVMLNNADTSVCAV
jgi:hypothetical protein